MTLQHPPAPHTGPKGEAAEDAATPAALGVRQGVPHRQSPPDGAENVQSLGHFTLKK